MKSFGIANRCNEKSGEKKVHFSFAIRPVATSRQRHSPQPLKSSRFDGRTMKAQSGWLAAKKRTNFI